MSDVSLPTVPVVTPVTGDSVVGERGGQFQRFPVNLLLMQPQVGPVAPAAPTNGKEWVNTVNGKKYTWFEDGDSGQWVESAGFYYADDPVSVAAAQAAAAAAAAAVGSAQFADYAGLRGYIGTSKAAYVTGYVGAAAPSGIAGLFTVDDTDATSADNGGTIIVAANGKRWKRVFGGAVNVRWFGATGVGVETAIFTSAATAAASGFKEVNIPFASFQVADGTDAQGCRIVGAATALTGRLVNHAGLQNCVVAGVNASDGAVTPAVRQDWIPKILWRSTADLDYVILPKATRGYVIAEFAKAITTNVGSLAATNSEQTRRRLSDCKDVVWAGVCKHAYAAVSGVWSEQTMATGTSFANLIPANNSGTGLKYWTANQSGNYIEFSVTPKNGRVNLAFFHGTTACNNATVSVDGTLVATINPRAAASSTIKVYSVAVPAAMEDQAVTVRVTHAGVNGDALSLIGAHFCELKDWSGTEADAFGYYRHNINWSEYLNPAAANDMVVLEDSTGLYGGSYHGGESAITSEWLAEGAAVAPAVGGFTIARSLVLRTQATVTWAAGKTLAVDVVWHFATGAISSEMGAVPTGIVAREAYIGMAAVKDGFTQVLVPRRIDLAAAADNSRTSLGRVTCATFRHPATGQRYRVRFGFVEREENQYGGAHIWRSAGTYNKLYVAPVHGGKRALSALHGVTVHEFE